MVKLLKNFLAVVAGIAVGSAVNIGIILVSEVELINPWEYEPDT
ncbi:hypothetical protein BH23BAC3_BH23BAC3_36190 [soil metagenome]